MTVDAATIALLIKEGEGLTVEFKERFTARIDEDMVAFANTRGGVILLGVRDNGTVAGETLTNDLKARIISLARNCSPPLQIAIHQADAVIAVEVPMGEEKPYSCSSGYFRRLDGATQKLTSQELRIMFQENDPLPFEEKAAADMGWNDISRDKLKAFLKEAGVSIRRIVPHEILASLNLVRKEQPTNGAALFFARNVRKFVLQCQMTLIAFKGKNRVHIYDRRDVQDDLLTQFNEAVLFLQKHLNRRSVIRGVNRQDSYEIPLEALREALVNAIIHRDYSIRGTSLMVEVYDDRVEITNPGGTPKGLTGKNFGKVSVRRNERIADIFYRMDKGERAGTGIQRMKDILAAAGMEPPEITHETFFTIVFRRPGAESGAVSGAESGAVSKKIASKKTDSAGVLHVLTTGEASAIEIARSLGKMTVTGSLKRILRELVEDGIIGYTIPEKPASRLQQYRLSHRARDTE